MERVYYRYIFRLKSPLALGSGISDNTDSDVLMTAAVFRIFRLPQLPE